MSKLNLKELKAGLLARKSSRSQGSSSKRADSPQSGDPNSLSERTANLDDSSELSSSSIFIPADAVPPPEATPTPESNTGVPPTTEAATVDVPAVDVAPTAISPSAETKSPEPVQPQVHHAQSNNGNHVQTGPVHHNQADHVNHAQTDQGSAVNWMPKRHVPSAVLADSHLSALFSRVQSLLGDQIAADSEEFAPRVPETLYDTGLASEEIERLILKFLYQKGVSSGREVAQSIRLPFGIVDPILKTLRFDQLLSLANTMDMGDYEYEITERGRDRARRYTEECTYFGAAPVTLRDYLKAMEMQSIAKQTVNESNLRHAFSDLLISPSLLDQLGPAINSGRGMFLFGEPGNGKTSIAERITSCFGSTIWIPRALGVDGDIIRLYDPGVHEEVTENATNSLFDLSGIDPRWVKIVRPTVVAGGELTMSELEVCQNQQTKVCEAPLQLKSNCGTFVIDDFGRQRMPVTELLNRWIVPLEKRYDFLNLPSGKKIQVPFDQLIIFSTNLEPKNLVDGAFLRRIPYKIQVPDPTDDEFREIIKRLSPKMGFFYDQKSVDYLIETHYHKIQRPFRSCQPRDLLLQVKNYCTYKNIPRKMSPAAFDFAVKNYFSVM